MIRKETCPVMARHLCRAQHVLHHHQLLQCTCCFFGICCEWWWCCVEVELRLCVCCVIVRIRNQFFYLWRYFFPGPKLRTHATLPCVLYTDWSILNNNSHPRFTLPKMRTKWRYELEPGDLKLGKRLINLHYSLQWKEEKQKKVTKKKKKKKINKINTASASY